MIDAVAVQLSPIGDLLALEREWRSIEAGARVSFFLTWEWIGSLIECLPADALPQVLRVQLDGNTIALALVGNSHERRRYVIQSRTLHLNETGCQEFDSLTIEHNGLLAKAGEESRAVNALFGQLDREENWDEFLVGGLTWEAHTEWMQASTEYGISHLRRWEKNYHFIDLARVRSESGDYLSSLSSNTRYQIRRAMKLYSTRGPLHLDLASSAEEAQVWLSELVGLHQAYWKRQGHPGAFATTFTSNFHKAVVKRGWAHGTVEILRVRAGSAALGYLYNFSKDGTIYNYQTGFVYEADGKLKPGMVCNAMAAQHALQRGMLKYDLLMGGGHHKSHLANAEGQMVWCVFQKPRLLLRVENSLRELATLLRSHSAAMRGEVSANRQRGGASASKD